MIRFSTPAWSLRQTRGGSRISFATHDSTPKIALLGSSAVDRVIAAFAIRTSLVPVRYFTSESAAISWLLDSDTTV